MSKLVSIVIPTYKRVDSLNRAIKSCLNQTYTNIEIIVVDDNGVGTPFNIEVNKIINSYSDKRIKYLEHVHNKNGAAARNTGIKSSKGDYICFLDDDDYFMDDKILKQLDYLEKNSAFDGVSCGVIKNGATILDNKTGNLVKDLLLMNTKLFTTTLFFRAEVFKRISGFDVTFRRHQDYELLIRFFQYYKMGYVCEPLVFLGTNSGENMLKGENLEKMKAHFIEVFKYDIEKFGPEFKHKCLCKHYSYLFLNHAKNLQIKYTIINFFRCISLSPRHFVQFTVQRLKLKL